MNTLLIIVLVVIVFGGWGVGYRSRASRPNWIYLPGLCTIVAIFIVLYLAGFIHP